MSDKNLANKDLAARAKGWMKSNDGGQFGVWWPAGSKPGDGSSPILAIMWDSGGEGEIGHFYDEKDSDAAELICDLANWAMEQLVPTTRTYFGEREYQEDESLATPPSEGNVHDNPGDAMSDLTDRAERLLAGITPGPWEIDDEGISAGPYSILAPLAADERFIAASPTLVADLLAEVKRLKGLRTADLRYCEQMTQEVERLTPREITTVEELAALPNASVVRSDEGCVWEKDISGWYEPGSRHGCVASDLALPATVLYLPEGGE